MVRPYARRIALPSTLVPIASRGAAPMSCWGRAGNLNRGAIVGLGSRSPAEPRERARASHRSRGASREPDEVDDKDVLETDDAPLGHPRAHPLKKLINRDPRDSVVRVGRE